MIQLPQIVRCFGERPLFIGDSGSVSYREFASMVEREQAAFSGSSIIDEPMATPMEWSPECFARLLGLLFAGGIVMIGKDFPADGLEAFIKEKPLLILRTGGSTGKPRHVVHAAAKLLSTYAVEEREPVRILVLYAAGHIAGLDAFFRALHRGSSLVVPADNTVGSIVRSIAEHAVEVLPATPSLLQFLLLSGELEGADLGTVQTIPHGAEPMPAALRKRISAAFPGARLVQRFGMTELGALPVREDPDDPAALQLSAPGYQWKVKDGELFVRCPAPMLGTLEDGPVNLVDNWLATGDLAEGTPRGTVRILGRRESLINVGGMKILPETVEQLLDDQPGVLDAVVFGIPNPLTGQAVAARVVHAEKPDLVAFLGDLRVAARQRGLSLAHVPTRIELVDQLPLTAAGKRNRGKGKA